MTDKPDIADEWLLSRLREAYGLSSREIQFLALGADENAGVYKVAATDGTPYFLKVRRGDCAEIGVTLPGWLRAQGLTAVLAPLPTQTGEFRTEAGLYKLVLYPFIEGKSGFEAALSPVQWRTLGATLKQLHTVTLPPHLTAELVRETFGSAGRDAVSRLLERAANETFADPVSAALTAFLNAKQDEIRRIVKLAEALAARLRERPREFVCCHADIHAGNVLLTAEEGLSIVDWDAPILAPKEHDLMFIGGGVAGIWNTEAEEAWFYEGYGAVEIDRTALAYYRYERIVQDFMAFGRQILANDGSREDREFGVRCLQSQFLPGEVVAMADRAYRRLHENTA